MDKYSPHVFQYSSMDEYLPHVFQRVFVSADEYIANTCTLEKQVRTFICVPAHDKKQMVHSFYISTKWEVIHVGYTRFMSYFYCVFVKTCENYRNISLKHEKKMRKHHMR